MSTTGVSDSNPIFETLRLVSVDGLTALAGGGQSTRPLDGSKSMHRVTTVASANDSQTLPPASGPQLLFVTNAAAANAMNVFPSKGESINSLSINAAFSVPAGKVALFIAPVKGQWHTILSA